MGRLRGATVIVFTMLGMVAPILWDYDVYRGLDPLADHFTPFFPFSLLYLGLPDPMNFGGWVFVAIVHALNAGLYGLIGYLLFIGTAATIRAVFRFQS